MKRLNPLFVALVASLVISVGVMVLIFRVVSAIVQEWSV